MKNFTKNVINQIYDLFKYNFGNSNRELIMAIFMQLFSFKFDDRVDSTIKFKDIQDITNKTWGTVVKKTNEFVGIPMFTTEVEKNKFDSLDLNAKTAYILNEIRGSIVHGEFDINEDGTITIRDEFFYMTFEFNCIVEICSIITQQLGVSEVNEQKLNEFLSFVTSLNSNTEEYNKSKIDFSFNELKYPLILFNLLPMNEDEFHNDEEYIEFITSLFADKELYIKGRLKDNTSLKAKELYRLRNCIAHGQFYVNDGYLILFENKDIFVFVCQRLDELFDKQFKRKIS